MGNGDGFHLRVLTTDGNSIREVMFVNHPPPKGDIVFSWHDPDLPNNHFTYHYDGYAHTRRSKAENRPLVQGPSLDDFTGFFCPSVFQLSQTSSEFPGYVYPPYEGKEHDDVVMIDVRLSDVAVNVAPYIIEAGKPFTEVISHPFVSGDPSDLRYYTVTDTDPWIVIAYWPIDLDHGFRLPQNSEELSILSSETGEPLPEDPKDL